MSSTPSPRPQDVAGFKDHAHGDAVLPSSPEEEQLTPIPATRGTHSSIIAAQPESSTPFETGTNPYSVSNSRYNRQEHNDLTFMGMNEFEPPDFSNSYLMEARFGDFPTVGPGNSTLNREHASTQQEEPMSATSTTSRSANTISRKSTGLATMSSSQLMSPQLTDAASPPSGFEGEDSPTIKHRLLGGGNVSHPSSNATPVDNSYPLIMQTPAATRSSVGASPNVDSIQGQFPAPRVQVESYSRGDSPARAGGMHGQNTGNKRRGSRTSPHLAAPALDVSDDGEYNKPSNEVSWHRQQIADPSGDYHLRHGLNPSQRDVLRDRTMMSLEEQQAAAELHAKNVEVSQWLSASETPTDSNPGFPASAPHVGHNALGGRPRAKSTGNRLELQADAFGLSRNRRAAQDASIPGPGLLIDEESGDDDDDEDSMMYAEEVPARIASRVDSHSYNRGADTIGSFPALPEDAPQALDAYPWIDPIYFPAHPGAVGQPGTSSEAMMRFAKRARDLETASRAATWGTNPRRLSDSDIQRVFGSGGLFSRLSISKHEREPEKEKDWRQFKESVESKVLNFLPKRSSSTAKRKQSEPARVSAKETASAESGRKDSGHKRKESLQSLHERKENITSGYRRLPSVKRPKSPSINTSGSAMTSSNIQVGGAGPASPTENQSPTHKHSVFRHAREMLSRHSSRDASEPNLTALWTQTGGPPLPNISSPPSSKDVSAEASYKNAQDADADADADADEAADEKGVTMNLVPQQDSIIPTFDGFKMNVRDLNPRLPVYLVDRLGQEQLRRYKKLIEFKVKHAQAIQLDKCESGLHCIDKGGVPTYFPAKAAQKESASSHSGLATAGAGEVEDDEDEIQDGLVTEAQFPPGVPMPPVKRLPAEFECPLCFSVKKFTKPSDWSKHVHEDLQPFTCTFQHCADPKSFKRKADWVRHENERHRQLEWWQCTEDGCAHQCYRRDNFVQHLVREHKMPEPKAKTIKPDNKPAVRGPAKTKGRGNKDYSPEDQVLMMVEKCRKETTKNPMDEPCKFCGNVCNTFKKLTVHLARHMEQISMPVLELVKIKDVTPDTIISPIEARLAQASISSTGDGSYRESVSISPFDQAMEPAATLAELPGAFNAISDPHFQQNHYNNVVAWNNTSGANMPMPVQGAVAYHDAHLAGPWMQGAGHYAHSQGPAFRPVEISSAAYSEQPPVGSTDSYQQMQAHVPHGLPIAYQEHKEYGVGMGQAAPHFHLPQYVNGTGSVEGGGGRGGGQPGYETGGQVGYGGGLDGATLYANQQAIHHSTQPQQRYFSSY